MAFTGLDELSKLAEAVDRNKTDRRKTKWLQLDDGQTVKLRFISELTEDSPYYNPDHGVAIAENEHKHPKDFKRKAVCSKESEGRCYGCEKNDKGEKGWYKRSIFYANVLVDNGVDEPYVAVWSMGIRKNPTFEVILEYARETGGVGNLVWRLKRSGEGTDTTYALIPMAPDATPFEWPEVDPFDLEEVLYKIPYERQAQWFGAEESNEAPPTEENIPW